MRVEPELPNHPQYRRLKRRVGDYALEALIRIWGHCQQNQRGELWAGCDAEYLEMIAEWDGDPGLLYRSLTDKDIGFVTIVEGGLRIHNWELMNQQTVKNWENGRNGGRPKKGAGFEERNPLQTHGLASAETQTQTGLPGISGGAPNNPVVTPIPVSVNPMKTQCEPAQRNETEHNVTTHNGTVGTERAEDGLRYDLAVKVIRFLNEQTGAEFKGTRLEIDAAAACLGTVGNDFEGVKKMVARQVALWSGTPKTAAWLQPRTLFDSEKFPSYFAMRHLPTDLKADPAERRRELEEAIGKHPANKGSVYFRTDCTEAQREELRALRQEQAELAKKNAGQKTGASSIA